tara:strand:- start:264 stop:539 length:276 start_codon:yes stop_codon:yes gene_type:complete
MKLTKSKLREIIKKELFEKLEMGYAGYRAYVSVTRRDFKNLERNFKTFINDLSKDKDNPDNKKMASELNKIYKKDLIGLKNKFESWLKTNT